MNGEAPPRDLISGGEHDVRNDGEDRLGGTLARIGFLVVGAGVYGLLGGDWESLRDYPIWVDFDAPPDAGEPQASPGAAGNGR